MDTDLESLSREDLLVEVRRLREGIRRHRDSSGHALCWHHPQLWSLLPERTDPVPVVPSWPEFMRGCVRYRQSLDEQAAAAPRSEASYAEVGDEATPNCLDHVGFNVRDLAASKAFFLRALAPLHLSIVIEGEGWAMLGPGRKAQFWIGSMGAPPGPLHLAFVAQTREQVRAFHAAALAAGGRDNGAPGVREHYHPDYYAAFVIAPDGHNIEAVCHAPEAVAGR